jgi:hypothetical protein
MNAPVEKETCKIIVKCGRSSELENFLCEFENLRERKTEFSSANQMSGIL